MKFRIAWRSNITGETGYGKRILTRKMAQSWCDLLNNKYPELVHWVD